jgi:hypothetical protein
MNNGEQMDTDFAGMKYLGASPEVSSLDRKFIVRAGVHTPIRRLVYNFFSGNIFNRGKPRGMNPDLPISRFLTAL